MNPNHGLSRVLTGGAIVLAVVQPAWAETQVTAVRIAPQNGGLAIVLETVPEASASSDRPQIFMVSRGDIWVADIVNISLSLGEGDRVQQPNPIPGITSIDVSPLDANSVRITVTGAAGAPTGQLLQTAQQEIVFGIQAGSGRPIAAPRSGAADRPSVEVPPPSVEFPNPDIRIESSTLPAENGQLPRAIAPPVGDIAVSTTDASLSTVNLETAERVPRLVLRNAPVRDVLALLARAAGLNLAFDEANISPMETTAALETPTISLDIEDEPIQDVFNYVLQLSDLDANRRGRTIFVGRQLPNAARNVAVRSLRMNQVQVGVALNFLVGMGAESAVSRERLVTSVNAVAVELPQNVGSQPTVTQTQTTTEERLETQRVNYEDVTPLLRGLLVLGDERTNTVTLVGAPRQIEIATEQLVQLDVRRRQVAVNVRVVDVNLSAIEDFSGSFSFGINDTFVQGIDAANLDGAASVQFNSNSRNGFSALLEAQITSGNAKILTDPTLIVQEGQTATVGLTEEVQTTTGQTTFNDNGDVVAFEQDDPRAAGLTLVIEVARIDDNGFVSLSVAPTITAPSGQQTNPDDSITTLLSSRTLQSGQLRLRDGQTLILTGIIQDSDRTTVTKVPILGDIPILGALFRSTDRRNERREVIVLLTPQILDDSDRSTFGYHYTPAEATQQFLQPR